MPVFKFCQGDKCVNVPGVMKCQLMLSQVCSVTVIIMCCSLLCDTKFNLNDSPHFSFKAESLSNCCSDTLIISLIYTWSELSIGKNQLRSYILFIVFFTWPCHCHNFIFFTVHLQSARTHSISNESSQKFVHSPLCMLSWCCPNHKLLFYLPEFPIFYASPLTWGHGKPEIQKTKIGACGCRST